MDRSDVQIEALGKLVEHARLYGGFDAIALATVDGDLVAAADSAYNPETLAATAGILYTANQRISDLIDFRDITSITMATPDEKTLMCSFFNAAGHIEVIVAISDSESRTQREIMKRTAEGIRRILSPSENE
jgi:predicted regulator of Ras-like GTPase activity (Roadblock/LC7/MglB family)